MKFESKKSRKKHLLFNVFWHPKAENIEKAFTFLSFLHHKYQNIKKNIVFYLISDDFPIVWLTITPGLPSSACNMIQLPCRRVTTFRLGICIVLISCTYMRLMYFFKRTHICEGNGLILNECWPRYFHHIDLWFKIDAKSPHDCFLRHVVTSIQFLSRTDLKSPLGCVLHYVGISYSTLIQNWCK